jgi:hypothetical protein
LPGRAAPYVDHVGPGEGRRPQSCPQLVVVDDTRDRCRQSSGVSGGDEKSFLPVAHQLRDPTDGGRDDRHAHRERLHDRDRQAFGGGRDDEEVRGGEEIRHVGPIAEQREGIAQSSLVTPLVHLRLEWALADRDEPRARGCAHDARDCVEQGAVPLLRPIVGDGEHQHLVRTDIERSSDSRSLSEALAERVDRDAEEERLGRTLKVPRQGPAHLFGDGKPRVVERCRRPIEHPCREPEGAGHVVLGDHDGRSLAPRHRAEHEACEHGHHRRMDMHDVEVATCEESAQLPCPRQPWCAANVDAHRRDPGSLELPDECVLPRQQVRHRVIERLAVGGSREVHEELLTAPRPETLDERQHTDGC